MALEREMKYIAIRALEDRRIRNRPGCWQVDTGRKLLDARWIAFTALLLVFLCSCQSSGGSSSQTADRQSSVPARDPSERVKEVSPEQLKDWMATKQPFTLIDVREDNEWQAGHAAAAMHISRWTLSGRITAIVPDKTTLIVLYCKGGARSAASAVVLQKMGYTNVFSLAGGFIKYQGAGLPIQR